jgi:predicted phage baseplate assembly protein
MNESYVRKLNDCGCCEGLTAQTPVVISNRPGLTGIAYRAGTHGLFKQSMLSRLSSSDFPALGELRTRNDNDFSISLLDAWATVADVITFYQERIANESYLRTATERRSLLELARLIGYELNPGVAASAYLAFTIEDAPGAPEQAAKPATIDIGTRVQSVPGPDEKPQIFETIEKIQAQVEWNLLHPRLTRPQHLAIGAQNELLLLGTDGSLESVSEDIIEVPVAELYTVGTDIPFEGDTIRAYKLDQIYIEGTAVNLKAGERFLVVGRKQDTGEVKTLVLNIQRVGIETELDRTRIDFTEQPKKLPRFILPVITSLAVVPQSLVNFTQEEVQSTVLNNAWTEGNLNAFMAINFWNQLHLIQHIAAPPPPKLPPPDQGVFAFRDKVGIFGHNAPHYDSMLEPDATNMKGNPHPHNWDESGGWDIWDDPLTANYYTDADVFLERQLSGILRNSWIVLETGAAGTTAFRVREINDRSVAGFGLSGKSTGLKLSKSDGAALTGNTTDKPENFKVRQTTAHVQSEQLILADLPIVDDLEAGMAELMLDRQVGGLQIGQNLILNGERADLPGVIDSELVTLQNIIHQSGFTTLQFALAIQHSYIRETVTLNGNVARATNGETVSDVLGSGDGSRPFQRFMLRQPPLTYVNSSTPNGTESTLEVRVNDLRWYEVPTLYNRGPQERVYVTRIDDDGNTSVQFGDGMTGARLPTGQENIRAKYRKGIGLEGMVKAGQLTTLLTRPLGVKEVTNPIDASGAQDRETLNDARRNAPLTVLTLDRAVSLRDYEDFARAFAGVAKAQAVWIREKSEQSIFITVAGPNGAEIKPDSDTYKNLLNALRTSGDPHVGFRVRSYRRAFFRVDAGLRIHPDYVSEKVLDAVDVALHQRYSFDERAFGQPVHLSEVTAVIQSVAGIEAVDVNKLYRLDRPSPHIRPRLESEFPLPGARDEVDAAELLILDPGPVDLEVIP